MSGFDRPRVRRTRTYELQTRPLRESRDERGLLPLPLAKTVRQCRGLGLMTAAGELADEILTTISGDVGVRIFHELVGDDYLFRGPHGRMEHRSYSDNLGHWKRGLYHIDEELRNRLIRSIENRSEYVGWCYVRRTELGEPEPVVVDISEPVRCNLCNDRFPSGNAFGWHLADVHMIDTDDKMEYAVSEPEKQHTLGKWAGGSA